MLKEQTFSTNKTKDMIEYLEGGIISGKLKADEKIPSIRDLMSQFSLSKGTVSRGLDYLCNEGFLEKRLGSGTYVKKERSLAGNLKKGAITIFSYQDSSALASGLNMFSQILLGIRDAAKIKNESISLVHGLGANPYYISPEQLEYANKNSLAIIFIGEYDSFYDDLDIRVPAIGAFMQNTFNGKLSLVNLDAYDAAATACKYFREKQQKHVIIATNKQPVFRYRGKLFEMLWKDAGGSCELKYITKEYSLPEGEAYFFASDTMAQFCSLAAMKKSGKPLHQTACVYSVEGKRFLDPHFHKFPTYAVDWRYVGKFIFEEANYRIENMGSPGRQVNVSGHLMSR
jgi:DNA-binding LacI/PurR family transcriptional regulator